jgi:hypothetical protein
LLPVPRVIGRTLPHHAARELDLVAQAAIAHATGGFAQVARDLGPLAGEVTRHPLDVVLELLYLAGHFRLALIEPLLALGTRRAGVRQVLDVLGDVALLVSECLGPPSRILDPTGLAGLPRFLEQPASVLELLGGGTRRRPLALL